MRPRQNPTQHRPTHPAPRLRYGKSGPPPRHQPNTTRHPPTRQTRPAPASSNVTRSQHRPTRPAPTRPGIVQRSPAQPGPIPVASNVARPGPTRPRHQPNTQRPRRARKKRVPEIRNPPYDSRSSANYFDSSASAALALSAAGPAVTFWKAAMACGFISLAL